MWGFRSRGCQVGCRVGGGVGVGVGVGEGVGVVGEREKRQFRRTRLNQHNVCQHCGKRKQ